MKYTEFLRHEVLYKKDNLDDYILRKPLKKRGDLK